MQLQPPRALGQPKDLPHTLVACRKQNTQRQCSVLRHPRGRARAWEGEAQALPHPTGEPGGAPVLAAPKPVPKPGSLPALHVRQGDAVVGEDGEPPGEVTLGASKGLVQKLTARAKMSIISPSEVDVLCSGQSSSAQSSSSSTFSAVLFAETMALHMGAAALQAQSSVSVGSWPQCRGPGHPRGPGWPPALPLPVAPRWQHPAGLALWQEANE